MGLLGSSICPCIIVPVRLKEVWTFLLSKLMIYGTGQPQALLLSNRSDFPLLHNLTVDASSSSTGVDTVRLQLRAPRQESPEAHAGEDVEMKG